MKNRKEGRKGLRTTGVGLGHTSTHPVALASGRTGLWTPGEVPGTPLARPPGQPLPPPPTLKQEPFRRDAVALGIWGDGFPDPVPPKSINTRVPYIKWPTHGRLPCALNHLWRTSLQCLMQCKCYADSCHVVMLRCLENNDKEMSVRVSIDRIFFPLKIFDPQTCVCRWGTQGYRRLTQLPTSFAF